MGAAIPTDEDGGGARASAGDGGTLPGDDPIFDAPPSARDDFRLPSALGIFGAPAEAELERDGMNLERPPVCGGDGVDAGDPLCGAAPAA